MTTSSATSNGLTKSEFVFGQPVGELYRDPAGYDPGPELESAVHVALLLGLPLLLTGEPGCGKTSVAHWLAWKLNSETLVCNVKSSSSGRDLLYEFDELSRFRDASAGEKRENNEYLRLNALGLAILFSAKAEKALPNVKLTYADLAPWANRDQFARRHVVLIDELDKAPRDTPNDLLSEIDQLQFEIRELNATIKGEAAYRPAVIITSNSEKSLPEPFLRRCVFHNISSPNDERRRDIISRRSHPFTARQHLFDQAMRYFDCLSTLSRTPGTSELLAWLTALEEIVARLEQKMDAPKVETLKGIIKPTLGTVAKTREDLELAERELINLGLG